MTYPTPSAPVDREVQGTLAQVEQRQGGFYRFHIMEPGNEWPTKADTKKVDLIQQAMSLMGQPVAAQIREQESTNINPNSGKPYINRHLNAIAPAGYTPGVMPNPGAPMPQQMPVQPGGQQQYIPQPQPAQPVQQAPVQPQQQFQPGLQGMEREIAIQRQTASKVAAQMLEILPPEQQTMQGLVALCEAWMAYYTYGPLRFGVQAFSNPQGQPALPTQSGDQDGRTHGVCPDCGFSGGDHLPGCPRGVPEETAA
jgi:hypothetical protein